MQKMNIAKCIGVIVIAARIGGKSLESGGKKQTLKENARIN
jgi:hypothetical protein